MEKLSINFLLEILPTWLTLIITLIAILIAYRQFISYRKELRDKLFIEFRQRLKADPINLKIFEYISIDNKEEIDEKMIPTEYEINHFFGLYEELHKIYIDHQLSIDDLVYFFGCYYITVFEDPYLGSLINKEDDYWIRAMDLYCEIRKNEKRVLTNLRLKLK
jgi:hypothetical protein